MSFTSIEFIIFIIAVLLLYYALPRRYQGVVLLCAGLYFYLRSGMGGFIFLACSTVSVWLGAAAISKKQSDYKSYVGEHSEIDAAEKKALRAKMQGSSKRILLVCLVFNIGILAVVKYAGLFASIDTSSFIIPLGISFYTFRAISYIMDVYWKKTAHEKSLFHFAAFMTFFPLMLQDPISRYGELAPSMFEPHEYSAKNIKGGAARVIWGFFKKLVIADRLAIPLRQICALSGEYRGIYVAAVILIYAGMLYADFTGGIDVTIGVSQMLGIRIGENFIRPYFSKSTDEYWRRWHISMGAWFRDYVFYPLYTSPLMKKINKGARSAIGSKNADRITMWTCTLLLWGLTGLWHGANMRFVVWGLCNGLIILISRELTPCYERFYAAFPSYNHSTAAKVFRIARTFVLMACVNIFDIYPDASTAISQFCSIFSMSGIAGSLPVIVSGLGISAWDWIIAAIGIALMTAFSLAERKRDMWSLAASLNGGLFFAICLCMISAILVFGIYGIGFDASQFIYNQF